MEASTTLPTSVETFSADETQSLAVEFADNLAPGDVIALVGELGSGKTVFARGVITALANANAVFHGSPTFALVQEYDTGLFPLYHFDFYRIAHASELYAIGWEDYLANQGVIMVEWADRFPELLPPDTRYVEFEVRDADTRVITIE
jgi:tRNA threonylcarbamoyladenosine biosynthesis protein TsaE